MILLDFDGKIEGASTVPHYEHWIPCESIEFGVEREVTQATGSSRERETSNPSFSDILITKQTDIASTALFEHSLGARDLEEATIVFIRTGGTDFNQPYLTIELHQPLLSAYTLSSEGSHPTELITINFTRISYRFDHWDGGRFERGQEAKWDLSTSTKY